MIDEVCKKTGSGPSKAPTLSCDEGAGGAPVDCHCAWASGIVAPNNIVGEAAAPGTVFTPPENPPTPPGVPIPYPNSMPPKDSLPIVQACLAARDHRTRISVPNALLLQCCSADLDYCVECHQDMQSACGVGPFSNDWANRVDGELSEVAAPRRTITNGGGGDCQTCGID
jgi:hypothetical protein